MIKFGPDEDFQLCLNMSDSGNGGIAGPTSTPLALWLFRRRKKKNIYSRGLLDKGIHGSAGKTVPTSGFRVDKLVEKYLPDAYFKRPDKKIDKPGHDNWHLNLASYRQHTRGPTYIHSLTVTPC